MGSIESEIVHAKHLKKRQDSIKYVSRPSIVGGRSPALFCVKRIDHDSGVATLEAVDPYVYYGMEQLRFIELDGEADNLHSFMSGIDLGEVASGDLVWVNE